MKKEAQLIKRIQKNCNRKAADQLIRHYYDEIYAYIFKQILDKHQAMDITQDIFITVLRSIQTYDETKAGFRTWLYRLSTNKLIDYYRKNARTTHDESISEEVFSEDIDLFLNFTNKALLENINNYLNKVEVLSQQVFRLIVFGNYAFREISVTLSMPESTVKSN